MVLSDTHARIEAKQLELIRSLEPGRKAELTFGFSWGLIETSRRLISDQHPSWSEQEVMLHWAEIHYGRELANRVREFLAQAKSRADDK